MLLDTTRGTQHLIAALGDWAERHASWPRYVRIIVFGSAAWLLALVTLTLVVDPWKVLPVSLPVERPVIVTNQRLLYPMLLRTRSFDSFIFGNSTGKLIDPAEIGRRFDERFANLALGDSRAWEQLQLLRYVLSINAAPRTLMFTMDWVWCVSTAVPSANEIHRFPQWAYAMPSWSNVWRMLNDQALVHALGVLAYQLRLYTPRIRDDGYYAFLPNDARYDAAAAQRVIHEAGRRPTAAMGPPAPAVQDAEPTFPALDLLQEVLAPLPASTRVVFVTMPVHVVARPRPGSAEAKREEACKVAIARLAARHGAALIDFRIPSPVTQTDANYWDPLHYRVSIARRLEQSIVTASTTLQSDPAGFWRVVDRR
jgi:hypothetical protein